MNNLFDVLEICLQELEKGADLETVLARYPDLVSELRPILKASIMAQARSADVSAPSPEVVRRGRAKLLQRAAQMREAKVAPRKRMIPIFQRLAISFTLATLFLASGTGLVGASSNSLPGEQLYPVKRTWEGVQIFFAFNPSHKEQLESEFEGERLNEVDELLTKGRDATIQFSGVFKQVKGVMYVSGVTVLIPATIQAPADGTPVVITGRTNAQGFVEIESIEILPAGVVVPAGKPVEGENESDSSSNEGLGSKNESTPNPNSGSSSNNESESGSGIGSSNETQNSGATESNKSDSQSFEMKGAVTSISKNVLVVNGQTVYLDNAKIDGVLKPGVNVEVKGFYAANGNFVITEVKVKDSGSGGGGNNEKSGSGSSDKGGSDSNGNSSGASGNSSSGSGSGEGGGSSGGDGGGSGGGGDGGGSDN